MFDACGVRPGGALSSTIGESALVEACRVLIFGKVAEVGAVVDVISGLATNHQRFLFLQLAWSFRYGLDAAIKALEAGVKILVQVCCFETCF